MFQAPTLALQSQILISMQGVPARGHRHVRIRCPNPSTGRDPPPCRTGSLHKRFGVRLGTARALPVIAKSVSNKWKQQSSGKRVKHHSLPNGSHVEVHHLTAPPPPADFSTEALVWFVCSCMLPHHGASCVPCDCRILCSMKLWKISTRSTGQPEFLHAAVASAPPFSEPVVNPELNSRIHQNLTTPHTPTGPQP